MFSNGGYGEDVRERTKEPQTAEPGVLTRNCEICSNMEVESRLLQKFMSHPFRRPASSLKKHSVHRNVSYRNTNRQTFAGLFELESQKQHDIFSFTAVK